MTFGYREAEKLKKECAKALRKMGHKAPKTGERIHKRKRFNKPDETKIREIKSDMTYTDWLELQDSYIEPLTANPDLFEDDLNDTVDK